MKKPVNKPEDHADNILCEIYAAQPVKWKIRGLLPGSVFLKEWSNILKGGRNHEST